MSAFEILLDYFLHLDDPEPEPDELEPELPEPDELEPELLEPLPTLKCTCNDVYQMLIVLSHDNTNCSESRPIFS